MKIMKPVLVMAAVLLIGIQASAQRVVEEIVAIVNDEVITLSDYKGEFNLRLQQLKAQQLSSEDYDKNYQMVREQLLDTLIVDKLLLQQAKTSNINVTDQLKSVIENIKKENNLASDDDLRQALGQQGMDYEAWKKQYEQMLLKQAVVYTEVDRNIVLNDSEIIDYYKKNPEISTVPASYKLRAVYLSEENWKGDALTARMKEISDRIKQGLSLTDAAAELSDAPLKDAKGELGTLQETEMDPDLHEAVKKLPTGGISAWTKAKTGWYLLLVEEKKDSRRLTFEESRKAIEEKIFGERRQVKLEAFIKDIRVRNFVKVLIPNPPEY